MISRISPRFLAVAAAILAIVGRGAQDLHAQRRGTSWHDRCETNDYGRRSRAKFCEEREFGMPVPHGSLVVDGGRNGGVEIFGWDRDSIHVIAHVQVNAGSPDEARDFAREIQIIHSGNEIRPDGPRSSGSVGWAVSLEIYLPRHSDLQVTTANGPAGVEDVFGSIDLESQNGPITLVGVGGDVKARAANGPLSIRLAGTKWEGTGLDAETINGPVDLNIPRDYSARLETGTVNGPFDTDSPLTVTFQGRRHSSRITSVLGAGGAPVRAVTTNGPVDIRRN